ncbi:MAG: hypothetical protein KGQ28_10465, partial [Hyphomicrobiales bacterium]|nr:hypothetical protein [Hyphomicrobiales bacterium]
MSAAAIADPRASAWRAAVRHSRRVGALRLAVPAAAVALIVAPLALRLLAPATAAAPPGPIAPGFVGDAMTMAAPKLSGYGRDGKRFALDARSATQRPDAPGKVGLDGVDARLIAADGAAT